MTQRRVGIFAGAGASRALFGQKVTKELAADFLGWMKSAECGADYLPDEIRTLLQHEGSNFELVMSHWQNIASAIMAAKRNSRKPPADVQDLSKWPEEFMVLRVGLARYFEREFAKEDKTVRSGIELLRRWCKAARVRAGDLFIVTTNYELGLERAVQDIWGTADTRAFWYPGWEEDQGSHAVPIFKLHGSLNWLECRGSSGDRSCRKRRRDLWQERLPVSLDRLPDLDEWRRTFSHGDKKWTPVMVPFVHHKDHWTQNDNEFWKELFDGVWGRARDMLESAEPLHFWGYSLPEADHPMSTMLWRALRRRQRGAIHVVEKAPDRKTALMVLLESLDLRPAIHLGGLTAFLEDQIKDLADIPPDGWEQ